MKLVCAHWFAMLTFSMTLIGCMGSSDAPETSSVYGTVKLDGQPLSDALVSFLPKDPSAGLRMATATTDSNGYYTLDYSADVSGLQPGQYKVSITTYRVDDESGTVSEEKIPVTYNRRSELMAEVSNNGGQFNFDLDSSNGEIIQPKPEDY